MFLAGHMSDPDELPGLAHFCEHMLFLGTKKYQTENEYSKVSTCASLSGKRNETAPTLMGARMSKCLWKKNKKAELQQMPEGCFSRSLSFLLVLQTVLWWWPEIWHKIGCLQLIVIIITKMIVLFVLSFCSWNHEWPSRSAVSTPADNVLCLWIR